MSRASNKNDEGAASVDGHPTRQAVLIDYLERYRNQTGAELSEWVQDLARQYDALVPPAQQDLSLPTEPAADTVDAYFRWIDGLRKQVQRWIAGDVRVPAEVEEAWVAALPEPYRSQCIHDLCGRHGVLAVEVPEGEITAEHLGEILEAAGRETTAAAPIFADGRLTEKDLPHVPDAIKAHERSASASLSMARVLRRFWSRSHGDDLGVLHVVEDDGRT